MTAQARRQKKVGVPPRRPQPPHEELTRLAEMVVRNYEPLHQLRDPLLAVGYRPGLKVAASTRVLEKA